MRGRDWGVVIRESGAKSLTDLIHASRFTTHVWISV